MSDGSGKEEIDVDFRGMIVFSNKGKYLVDKILEHPSLELAFVWNRTYDALGEVNRDLRLKDLIDFPARNADLIVEVAHPDVTREWGPQFLKHADYMIGSPTALSSGELEQSLRNAASSHALYVPSGAFWGAEDIKKMADRGTLKKLHVTMTKHPSSFKLSGEMKNKLDQVSDTKTVLFNGPVRDLCPLAPNNVNTMAAAATAAHNLGFDEVTGSIVADPQLTDWHTVEVEVWGSNGFHVNTVRSNPANVGAVTGSATYASFLSSMLAARGKGPGVHLC